MNDLRLIIGKSNVVCSLML